jgi:hypothetical protein
VGEPLVCGAYPSAKQARKQAILENTLAKTMAQLTMLSTRVTGMERASERQRRENEQVAGENQALREEIARLQAPRPNEPKPIWGSSRRAWLSPRQTKETGA